MERKIDRINYKSDFPAVLKLRDARGNEVLFPDCDWEAVFWAFSKGLTYRASCIKGEYTNCFRREDGRICVIFNNHNLGTGVLKWEPHFMFPDALFPDGVRDLYSPEPLDIELVPGRGDDASEVEVEAMLPYIKGDTGEPGKQGEKGERGEKGDPFTFDDFTPEQLAALKGEKGEKGDTGREHIRLPRSDRRAVRAGRREEYHDSINLNTKELCKRDSKNQSTCGASKPRRVRYSAAKARPNARKTGTPQ